MMRVSAALLPLILMATPSKSLAQSGAEEAQTAPFQGKWEETIRYLRDQHAESRDLRPEALFFEPSKVVAPLSGNSKPLFEAEIEEPFFPFQNRPSVRDRYFGGWYSLVALTPQYRARQWGGRSSPVRTPSFMPKGTLQYNYLAPRHRAEQWGESGPVHLTSIMVIPVGHHSNGQDGCPVDYVAGREPISPTTGAPLFTSATDPLFEKGDDTPACRERMTLRPLVINRINGSFSTNYTKVSVYHALFWMKDDDETDDPDFQFRASRRSPRRSALEESTSSARYRVATQALYAGVSYENNWGMTGPLRPLYGPNRFGLVLGYTRGFQMLLHHRWPFSQSRIRLPRFTLRATLTHSDRRGTTDDCGQTAPPAGFEFWSQPCAPNWSWGTDLNVSLGSRVDFMGLYFRFYQGQDDYNLGFTHRKDNRFEAGIAFTPGRSQPYRLPIIRRKELAEEGLLLSEPDAQCTHDCAWDWKTYKRYINANSEGNAPCPIQDPDLFPKGAANLRPGDACSRLP